MVDIGERGSAPESVGSIRDALLRWASGVFAAPLNLDEHVTSIVERDEVLARVTTTVVRRDLFEQRAPAVSRAQGSDRPVERRVIDPFALSLDELRARTSNVTQCEACGGSAQVSCGSCAGSGRQRCAQCGGSGHVTRYYKKSSRVVQCTGCRTSGTVPCVVCDRSGRVACGTCSGSGLQLRWWAYRESVRVVARFSTESAVLDAHPALREERPLRVQDLAAFSVQVGVEGDGMLPPGSLAPDDEAMRARLTPPLDPQLERVRHQQYARFSVPCRDVTYELCGAVGTVVLSGTQLAAARTPEALRPIRRRAWLWAVAALGAWTLAVGYSAAFRGPTAWFASTNQVEWLLSCVAMGAAWFGVGGLLRAWRPGFRRWAMRPVERVAFALASVALFSMPVVSGLSRPDLAEARAALSRGELARSRLVVDALIATHPTSEVMSALDELEMREAANLTGDARLAKLDAIAARNGSRSNEARAEARRIRLDAVRSAITARQPAVALQRLDQGAQTFARDAEAIELRAAALDAQRDACDDEACRYQTAMAARAVHPTPTRDAAVSASRARLLSALSSRDRPADVLASVRSLRALTQLATRARPIHDDAVVAASSEALTWASAERAQIALVGAPVAAVDELLERTPGTPGLTGWTDLQGVSVFAAATADGRCEGLYVVGATAGARSLSSRSSGATRLLAQATGRPSAAIAPRGRATGADATSRWSEGRTRVLARWRGDALMELRIGRADPWSADRR